MNEYILGLITGLLLCVGLLYLDDVKEAEAAEVEEYCYAPYSTHVIPERMSTKATVEVVWYHEGARGADTYGAWDVKEDGSVECTLWVRMPQQVLGDPDMDSMGHEFLHCVAGNFHPEDE